MDKNTTFYSFLKYLQSIIEITNPANILEFGPGESTKEFLKYSKANIYSIENNIEWYSKYKDEIKDERFRIFYAYSELSIIETKRKFDLIFIDGGDRLELLQYVYQLLSDTGIIYLHDAHREEYYEGIMIYKYRLFIEKHSCLLMNNESIYSELKNKIGTDYNCSCRYCSSPERIKYFEQFNLVSQ